MRALGGTRRLAMLAFAGGAFACGGPERAPTGAGASGSLEIRAVDAATRAGVAGARLEVVDGADAGRSATTGPDGVARLEGLRDGAFTLRATHPQFHEATQPARTGGGRADLVLRPAPCETASCGAVAACNRALPLLVPPFHGTSIMTSQFDHDTPQGFGVENGRFVNSCGQHATYDGHNGYDWLLPRGTPLRASAAGRVVFAGREDPFFCPFLGRTTSGIWVELDVTTPTGEVLRLQYGHLDSLAVEVGQAVAAGEVIGSSGNTGCSTAPHLHFAVLRSGERGPVAIDPFGWQGQGDDPWGIHPEGAYSPWLWATVPDSILGAAQTIEALSPSRSGSRLQRR